MWVIHFSIKKWLGEISYETSYVTMKHQIVGDLAKPLAQLISSWADTEQNARCSLPASLPCKRRCIINTHVRAWNWMWMEKTPRLSHYGGTLQPCSTALWPLSPPHAGTAQFPRVHIHFIFPHCGRCFRQPLWIFSYDVLHYIHVLHIYKFRFHRNALELHANLQANIGGLLVPDPDMRPLPCSAHPVTHLFHRRLVGT